MRTCQARDLCQLEERMDSSVERGCHLGVIVDLACARGKSSVG